MRPATRLAAAAALPALLGAALLATTRTVVDDEMAWSLHPGDRVLLLPDRPRKADVVALPDPLEPTRTVLRRVLALGGDTVRWDDASFRVNEKRLRQEDMGDVDGARKVLRETIWSKPPARANTYLPVIRNTVQLDRSGGKVTVPDGHLFLVADHRDAATDSRLWGPVPAAAIRGVVRARWGQDGPWQPAFALWLPEE